MANIELDGGNKKITVDSGDLTLDIPGDIILDADGADVVFADGGTNILKITNSSSDVVFQPQVDAKDIIFKQYDGTTVATVEDNGTFNIPASKLAIGGTAVTSTAAELNLLDGGTSWQSIITSNTTMVAGRGYFVNTTGGAITMTLPSSASLGDEVSIIDYAATADTNNITIGRNSHKIQGDAADLTVSTERAAFTLVYVDATHGWLLTNK